MPWRNKNKALHRIQDIHAWEACDEASARFRDVAEQIERELAGETLSASEREQLEPVEVLAEDREEEDEEVEERSSVDDAVAHGSAQDSWIDNDSVESEDWEWVPVKRPKPSPGGATADEAEAREAKASESSEAEASEFSEARDSEHNVICLTNIDNFDPDCLDPDGLLLLAESSDIETYCISNTEDCLKHLFRQRHQQRARRLERVLAMSKSQTDICCGVLSIHHYTIRLWY